MSTFVKSTKVVPESGLKGLVDELVADPFINETPPYCDEGLHVECKRKVAAVCEAVEALQLRIAEMEREFREKEREFREKEQRMVESYEMQVWRVTEGLPRYDTWGKPVKVNPNDQPIIYPVPDPSKY